MTAPDGAGDGFKKLVKLRPCSVCEAPSTGYHFGVMSCEACKSFFRRSLKRMDALLCSRSGTCVLKSGEVHGTPCSACRMKRCLQVGMSTNAVRKGRYSLERRAETIIESRKFSVPRREPAPSSRIPDRPHPPSFSPDQPPPNAIGEALNSPSVFDSEKNSMRKGNIATLMGISSYSDLSPPSTEQAGVSSHATGESNLTTLAYSQTNPTVIQPIDLSLQKGWVNIGNPPRNSPVVERTSAAAWGSPSEQNNGSTTWSNHNNTYVTQIASSTIDLQVTSVEAGQSDSSNTLEGLGALLSGADHLTQCGYANINTDQDVVEYESIEELFNSFEKYTYDKNESFIETNDENIAKLTERTVEALDHQNFLTRGFLAKMPELQYTYLKNKEERVKMFGCVKPLNCEDHKEFFEATGVDVDGRHEALLKFVEKIIIPYAVKSASYICRLPGVSTLPSEDKYSLLKRSILQLIVCVHFPATNANAKLIVHHVDNKDKDGNLSRSHHIVHDEDFLQCILGFDKNVLDIAYEMVRKVQDLSLTDQEYAMVAAVCTIRPRACVTNEGRAKCQILQQRMFQALEKILHKRLKPSGLHRILGVVHELNENFESIEDSFYSQWTQLFISNRNLKFPKLLWDLLPISSTNGF